MKYTVTILTFLSTNSVIYVIFGVVLNDYFFLFIMGSIFMCFCMPSEFQLDASVLLTLTTSTIQMLYFTVL